jgi:hypothetical protein
MTLPKDAKQRKSIPIASGVLGYFPDAIAAVAECSQKGNEQHHPGKPLHWDRSKSTDEADALIRHFMERGTVDSDGIRHSAKTAWRALALLQKEIEAADVTDALARAGLGDTEMALTFGPIPVHDESVPADKDALTSFSDENWKMLSDEEFLQVFADGKPITIRGTLSSTFGASPDPDGLTDGWVKWEGGECPVPKSANVEVRFRHGGPSYFCDASLYDWQHYSHGYDIIAYKVVK